MAFLKRVLTQEAPSIMRSNSHSPTRSASSPTIKEDMKHVPRMRSCSYSPQDKSGSSRRSTVLRALTQSSVDEELFGGFKTPGYDTLLRVTTNILEWMSGDVHLKSLVNLIVEGVYNLVPSDRVTLYFADNSKKELWVAISKEAQVKGLRIPFGTGIAGQVAVTGKLWRSNNCYDDKQFHKAVDRQTGFRTNTMICVPICSHKTGETLGVFAAINRLSRTDQSIPTSPQTGKYIYTDTDCRLLKIFALQISVALRKCTLQLALQKMAMDNALVNQHDVQLMNAQKELLHSFAQTTLQPAESVSHKQRQSGFVPPRPKLQAWPSALPDSIDQSEQILRWDLDVLSLTTEEIVHHAEYILLDMCFPPDNEQAKLCIKPFILAVAKGYHAENPFHNLYHAFSVLHITYMQLKKAATHLPETLTPLHAYGMLIAAFCHDLDHPGVNDVFLVNSNHPISWGSALGDGLLERHHCRKTFEILSVDANNVIGHLKGSQYKRIRKVIIQAIMSTNMAKHMQYVKRAVDLANDLRGADDEEPLNSEETDEVTTDAIIGPFHVECDELEANLQLLIDIMVHCADLSGQALPWHLALKWGKRVNKEFHEQWVKEKQLGLPPTPYMEGLDNITAQCKGQLYFVNAIILPLWNVASRLLPSLAHLAQNAKDNVEKYKTLLKEEELKLKSADQTATNVDSEMGIKDSKEDSIVPPPTPGPPDRDGK